MPTHTNTKGASGVYRMTLSAILVTIALIFSYLESIIPLPIPVPGIKLGFANIAIVVALYKLGGKSAFVINIVRIILAGLLFTGFSAMLYALTGGIISVIVMIALKNMNIFSTFGVSVGGASAHIIGQILLAAFVIQNSSILMLLPILLISAVLSGIIIGFISQLIINVYLKDSKAFQN